MIRVEHGAAVLGEPLTGTVQVQLEVPTRARSVSITLIGEEQGARHRHELLRSRQVLSAGGVLSRGYHTLPFVLPLPAKAPPSFECPFAWVRYRLVVEIDVPWWPDPRRERTVQVLPPAAPVERPPSRHRVISAPAVDVSLASTAFAPGDVLRGVVAVDQPEVSVTLLGEVQTEGGSGRTWRLVETSGRPGPFQLRIPASATPGFTSTHLSVRWYLEVGSGRVRGRLPVTILPPGCEPGQPTQILPLGAAWHDDELRALGERHGLDRLGDRLVGRAEGGQIELRIDAGELRGELRFASLRLGVRRQPDGILATHVTSLGRQLSAGLRPVLQDRSARLLDLDDTRVVASSPSGRGAELVRWLRAFAEQIERVRHRLVPPGPHGSRLAHWHALAAALDGRLEPGPLHVSAVRGGLPVSVSLSWLGEDARSTRLEVDVSALPRKLAGNEHVLELPGSIHPVEQLVDELDRLVQAVKRRLADGPFR